jgi:hypothetical protein
MEKPHKGTILGVREDFPEFKNAHGPSLGYIVVGYWQGHPDFGFSFGNTSLVVKKGRWKIVSKMPLIKACEIETLNSRYTWKYKT